MIRALRIEEFESVYAVTGVLSGRVPKGSLMIILKSSQKLFSVRISVGILFLPTCKVYAHLINTALCGPSENLARLCGIGVALVDISGTAGRDFVVYFFAGSLFICGNDLKNGISVAGTDVEVIYSLHLARLIESLEVSVGKINNVNVITHTRTVGSIVIVSENREALKLTAGDLGNIRKKIVRNSLRIFCVKPLSCAPIGLK